MRRHAVAPLFALVLSACGAGGSASDGGIVHPTGEAAVLRVEDIGGLVMANWHLTALPAFTLIGDGRVILPGAQIDIFPGPALPALQERRLTPAGMQAVLQAVAASEQFGESRTWEGARNFVADAPDTVFTLHADGREVTVSVYALGLADMAPQGMKAEERAAHTALTALRQRLETLDGWLGEGAWADPAWRDYRADALRLVVRNADADPPDQSGIPNAELPWPVAGDPATFGQPTAIDGSRCGVVSGADAEAWYEALATANQLTRWTVNGHRFEVGVRPLLPDEQESCPELS